MGVFFSFLFVFNFTFIFSICTLYYDFNFVLFFKERKKCFTVLP